MVRPLPFYFPVYKGDAHGKGILRLGMWLYDLLALFRSPGFHRNLSARAMAAEIPGLNSDGLRGGFRYYDASMWDAELAVETIRAAVGIGKVAAANYVEAVTPIWEKDMVADFQMRDLENPRAPEISVRAKRTVVARVLGRTSSAGGSLPTGSHGLSQQRRASDFRFEAASRAGALVMSHPDDGRISFVIRVRTTARE